MIIDLYIIQSTFFYQSSFWPKFTFSYPTGEVRGGVEGETVTVNSRETTANEKRRRIMIKQMKMRERQREMFTRIMTQTMSWRGD